MIITGAELKTKKGHENCGALDGDMYEYENSTAKRIPTDDEMLEESIVQKKRMLLEELQEASAVDMTDEVTRIKSDYIMLCDGRPVKCKSELESELATAQSEADELFNAYMIEKGVWA